MKSVGDNSNPGESATDLEKKLKAVQAETKLQHRQNELQIQEYERRLRQKDVELQRFRDKLSTIATAERNTEQKHRVSLASLKQGEIIRNNSSKQLYKKSMSTKELQASFKNNNNISIVSDIYEDYLDTSMYPTQQQPHLQVSAASSPQVSPLNNARQSKTNNKPSSGSSQSQSHTNVYLTDVVEALESQNDTLHKENKELYAQVNALSNEVKQHMKYKNSKSANSTGINKPSNSNHNNSSSGSGSKDKDDTYFEESSVISEGNANGNNAVLVSVIQQQATTIKQLQHQLEVCTTEKNESENTIGLMRNRAQEYREEIENLRLELQARPSMKQYSECQSTIKDLEDKLHDIIMMRNETNEINAWRKYVSTTERIKIDKRNHELGLWLIDSLPKAVIKEVLQAICRELNISDVSEIQPTIVKLKTVIKAVPRMERFITYVTSYVFERQLPALSPQRLSQLGLSVPNGITNNSDEIRNQLMMEDVIPVLRSWWQSVQNMEELQSFEELMIKELYRREHVLNNLEIKGSKLDVELSTTSKMFDHANSGDSSTEYNGATLDTSSSEYNDGTQAQTDNETNQLEQMYGSIIFPSSHSTKNKRDRHKMLVILRELIDFQLEIFTYKSSLKTAEEYITSNPEVLVNRLMAHIKYLFNITSLEGLIPKMNQIYLYCEEMKNFVHAMRDVLYTSGLFNKATASKVGNCKDGVVNDTAVINEVQKIVLTAVSTMTSSH